MHVNDVLKIIFENSTKMLKFCLRVVRIFLINRIATGFYTNFKNDLKCIQLGTKLCYIRYML